MNIENLKNMPVVGQPEVVTYTQREYDTLVADLQAQIDAGIAATAAAEAEIGQLAQDLYAPDGLYAGQDDTAEPRATALARFQVLQETLNNSPAQGPQENLAELKRNVEEGSVVIVAQALGEDAVVDAPDVINAAVTGNAFEMIAEHVKSSNTSIKSENFIKIQTAEAADELRHTQHGDAQSTAAQDFNELHKDKSEEEISIARADKEEMQETGKLIIDNPSDVRDSFVEFAQDLTTEKDDIVARITAQSEKFAEQRKNFLGLLGTADEVDAVLFGLIANPEQGA